MVASLGVSRVSGFVVVTVMPRATEIYEGSGVWTGAVGAMVDMFQSDPNNATFPINAWAFFWVPSN